MISSDDRSSAPPALLVRSRAPAGDYFFKVIGLLSVKTS